MKVIIVEDEAIAADNLESMVKQLDPAIHIMAKIESVRDTVKWLQQNTADLIFMDIHLSDGLSFSIFEEINLQTPVIFTTAYDQYTMKAFKVYSIDYLLKPIEISELQRSLEKYKSLTTLNLNKTIDVKALIESISGGRDYQKRFVVYAGQKIKMIKTSEIAYFYGSDDGNFLCTFTNQMFGIDFSLDKLENIIDPECFFRINRNFIVNIEAIKEMYTMSKSRIKIELNPKTEHETLVSFNRMSNFRKWINR